MLTLRHRLLPLGCVQDRSRGQADRAAIATVRQSEHYSGGLNTGKRAHPLCHLPVKVPCCAPLDTSCAAHDIPRQKVCGIKARRDVRSFAKLLIISPAPISNTSESAT